MFCLKCGTPLVEDASYCHRCGSAVEGGREPAVDEPAADVDGGAEEEPAAPAVMEPEAVLERPGVGREAERILWEGGFSPRSMVGAMALAALLSLLALVVAIVLVLRKSLWAGLAFFLAIPLIWLLHAVRALVRRLSYNYRLTNRRLFVEVGFWNCQKRQLELEHVEEVRVRQKLSHRLLGVGCVDIFTSDRRLRQVTLEGIEQPDQVAELIRACASSSDEQSEGAESGPAS